VNGKPHPIDYFDVVDERGAEPAPNAAPSASEPPAQLDRRRMIVLLFDTITTSHDRIHRAQIAAQKFVKESRPGDTFAVARLTRDGVMFIVPFTTDRVALQHAIATLRPSRAGDAFALATLESERVTVLTASTTKNIEVREGDARSTTDMPDNVNVFANAVNPFPTETATFPAAALQAQAMAQTERVEEQRRRDDQTWMTYHLGDLADRLSSISGVKHVIFLSEGATGGADLRYARKMYDRFRAAGVILDAVALDSLNVLPDLANTSARLNEREFHRSMTPVNDPMATLYNLALETGGTVAKHPDIRAGLRAIRDLQSVTYILGFRPRDVEKEQNEITVRVKNQPFGTTVAYRRGFSLTVPRDRGDGLFLADVLMNDIPQRGLTLDLKVEPQGRVANVTASVPGPELLAHRPGYMETAVVDVFLYVFDEKDLVAGWGYSRLRIDLAKGRDFLSTNPYKLGQKFELTSGRYTAKALLRFVNSDVTAFQKADFEIAR